MKPTSSSLPDSFRPALSPDFVRVDVGDESVVWSAGRSEPAVLDPVAQVMLSVIDGEGSIADLSRDVHEVVGLAPDLARQQVERIVSTFDRVGLLTTSSQHGSALDSIRLRSMHIHPVSYCIDSESRRPGVLSVNLRLGDQGVRVACGSRRAARQLRRALSDHLVEEEQPLGFLIQKPHGRTRAYRLTDRGGVVLASALTVKPVLASLAGHLSAFLSVANDVVRLRVGVLANDRGYVACAPPLLFVPPPHRDRLSERGWGLVDRLTLDVAADGRATVTEVPWPEFRALPLPGGHRAAAGEPRLLAVALHGPSGVPSPASAVSELARTSLSGTPESVLATLHALVGATRLIRLPQQSIDELPLRLDQA